VSANAKTSVWSQANSSSSTLQVQLEAELALISLNPEYNPPLPPPHSGPPRGLICPKCKLPHKGSSFAGIMHSFAGMVHNEDTTRNIDQIPHILDLMSIFLDLILSA
jgi:hypothetical protein